MIRRSRFVVVGALLGAGLAAVVLLPGRQATVANAETTHVALTSVSSPSPDLLKRLDAAVAPPMDTPATAVAPDQTDAASVQPVSLTTGVDLASPTAAVNPAASLKSDTVGGSAVNLRAGPSSSAQQLSVLQPGETIQTGQTIGGWVQVTRADGSTGWVYSSYLSSSGAVAATSTPKAQPARAASAQPRAVIKGDTGDLEDRTARIASRLPAYARPRDSAQSIFTFEPGDQVRIAEVRGDWLRVETDEGISAWIRR
jgi:SH3-like domain-containing protein